MYFTKIDGKERRLPDFIIPGAAKSGTTTLYQQLTGHPEIFFPKERKEPFYFSFGGVEPNYEDTRFNEIPIWDTHQYLSLYSSASSVQQCGDASTSYLYMHDISIANMRKLYGEQLEDVKIIIILRNPVTRAYSHYTYLIRNGFESRSFEEAITPNGIEVWKRKRWGFDYLKYGEYARSVQAYLNAFKNVQVYLTEDLKDAKSTMSRLCQFLEVDEIVDLREVMANPSGIPKNKMLVNALRHNRAFKAIGRALPEKTKLKAQSMRDRVMSSLLTKNPMSEESRSALQKHYEEDIEKLSKIISRDLSHWK